MMKVQTRQGVPTLTDGLVKPATVEMALAILVCGLAGFAGYRLLDRGVWFDEIFTLSMTGDGVSAKEFVRLLFMDAHPALHFLIVEGMQLLGVSSLIALRLANLLGLPLIFWALMIAERDGAVTRAQSLTVVILSASSWVFLDNFAEARPYFLLAAASVATSLIWRVLSARIETGKQISAGLLTAWGFVVLIFANLQYFGTIMAGILTGALLVQLVLRGDLRESLRIGLVAMAGAAPAVILAAIQARHQPVHFWIQTTPVGALELYVQFLRATILNNLAATAFVIVGIVVALDRGRITGEERAAMLLLGVMTAFFAAAFLLNLAKPMVIPRYLTPAIGPVLVAAALMAARDNMPKWTVSLIGVFALLAQTEAIVTNKHARGGWDESARLVVEQLKACPTTRVYTEWDTGAAREFELDRVARHKGYDFVAQRHSFSYTSLKPGDVIAPSNGCPAVLWLEHVYQLTFAGDTADSFLKQMGLTAKGDVEFVRTSSGALLLVR